MESLLHGGGLHWGLSNAATAAVLALLAAIATKLWKNPHFAHAAWLIVLLRLVAPPLVPLTVPIPDHLLARSAAPLSPAPSLLDFGELSRAGEGQGEGLGEISRAGEPSAPSLTPSPSSLGEGRGEGPPLRPNSNSTAPLTTSPIRPTTANQTLAPNKNTSLSPAAVAPHDASTSHLSAAAALTSLWIAGTVLYALIVILRARRFAHGLKRSAGDVPESVRSQASEIAATIGLRRLPRLAVIEGPLPPMVWSGIQPVVLLPRPLVETIDVSQRRLLLLHELLHIRRHDHLVRWLEIAVLALYWWNPFAWWSVRRLQRAEEECCDAAVLALHPHQSQTYGEALLAVSEFVSTGRLPAPALSIGVERRNHLKRRMTMILDGPRWPSLSKTRLAAIGICGALVIAITLTGAVSQNDSATKSQSNTGTTPVVSAGSDIASHPIDAAPEKNSVDRDARIKELEKQLSDTRAELEKARKEGNSGPQAARPGDPANELRNLPGASQLHALPTLAGDSEQQKQLKRRYNAALRAEQLNSRRYEIGEARVKDLLDTEKTLLEAQLGLCKSEQEETQARVNYFVAVKRIEFQAKAKLSIAGVTGSTPVDDEDLARSARLDAELKLRERLAGRADTSPRRDAVTRTTAANPQPTSRPTVNPTPGMPPVDDLPVLKPLPGDSERQRLLKARYNAAVRAEELYLWQYDVGTARASDVLATEKILLEAGLALCKSEREEIQVREKYFNAVKRLEAQTKAKLDIGGVSGFTPADEAQAREARLDAELTLMQKRAALAADNSPDQKSATLVPPSSSTHTSGKLRAEALPAMLTAKPLEPAPGDDELLKLQKERYNAALRTLKSLYERFLFDVPMPSPMISIATAGRTLLDARVAMSQDRVPIRVYEGYLELTKYFEGLAQSMWKSKAAAMSPADFEAAHEARIDADIKLLEARRRAAKTIED